MPLRNGLQGNLLRCKRDKTRAEKTVKTKNLVLAVFFFTVWREFFPSYFLAEAGMVESPGNRRGFKPFGGPAKLMESFRFRQAVFPLFMIRF